MRVQSRPCLCMPSTNAICSRCVHASALVAVAVALALLLLLLLLLALLMLLPLLPLLLLLLLLLVVVLLLLQHSRSWWKGAPATCSGSAVAAPALATAAPQVPLAVLWHFCRFEGAFRKRELHLKHSVAGPSGPAPLPLVSLCVTLHQPHTQSRPAQLWRCIWTAPALAKVRSQRSHSYVPSAFVGSCGAGPVCPFRKRGLHLSHSVAGPSGPAPLALVSLCVTLHQPHAQSRPAQLRR
jgi:hypothetical protein